MPYKAAGKREAFTHDVIFVTPVAKLSTAKSLARLFDAANGDKTFVRALAATPTGTTTHYYTRAKFRDSYFQQLAPLMVQNPQILVFDNVSLESVLTQLNLVEKQ